MGKYYRWFSAVYIENRKVIYKLFKFSNCADELFIQTLIYNSKYRYRLYDEKFDNSIDANKRFDRLE